MQRIARLWFPYMAMGLFIVAMVWATSFGTLEPADFTFCNGTEIQTVDPAQITGEPEGRVVWSLFEGLCNLDPATLKPIPGVAERWDISPDGKIYTFHIRSDARWSNGDPITAEDFHYSFRRTLDPLTASQYAFQLWYVQGARQYTSGEVEENQNVEIELEQKPEGSFPFARGTLLQGRLVKVESTTEEKGLSPKETNEKEESTEVSKIYHVEIDGQLRRFHREGMHDAEKYLQILPDFRDVGVRVVDASTLQIELESPTPYFLSLTAFYTLFPVHQECVESRSPQEWIKPEYLVCNGAFRLESRRLRDRIRMVRNEQYWNKNQVKVRIVDVLAAEGENTMLNLYLTGQVDWITNVPNNVIPTLLEQKRPDFHPQAQLTCYFYRLNVTKPGLEDKRVRQALSLGLDRREIVEKITRAGEIPAYSLVPPGIPGYVPSEAGQFDPEKARRLLAEAGFPDGKGLPAVEIMYNTSDTHKDIAELVQSQWKKNLGIDVRLNNQEWANYLTRQQNMDYVVSRAGWNGDYLDPNTFLDMFLTGGTQNNTGWGNPEYDRLIELAQKESNLEKRMDHFHQAEAILMDEMPILPFYFYVSKQMARPYVHGFHDNIMNFHPLWAISIDATEKEKFFTQEGLR